MFDFQFYLLFINVKRCYIYFLVIRHNKGYKILYEVKDIEIKKSKKEHIFAFILITFCIITGLGNWILGVKHKERNIPLPKEIDIPIPIIVSDIFPFPPNILAINVNNIDVKNQKNKYTPNVKKNNKNKFE